MTRKHLSVACVVGFLIGGGNAFAVESATKKAEMVPVANATAATNRSATINRADEVLAELLAGNERFVKGKLRHPRRTPDAFRAIAKAQDPVAVIVACADSRVAPELLFDMGVGDLFVVRVAGNVVDGAGVTVKGSIEYAIAELNTPLIVVLGHSNCGAVNSAVTHIHEKDSLPGAIDGLVELVKPAVLKAQGETGDIYTNATRENVRLSVEKLKNLQPILAPSVEKGDVKVVGGIYDLHTGRVELLPTE